MPGFDRRTCRGEEAAGRSIPARNGSACRCVVAEFPSSPFGRVIASGGPPMREVLSPHCSLPGIDSAGRNRGRPAYERVYSRDRYRHYRRRAAGRHGHGQQRRERRDSRARPSPIQMGFMPWASCRGPVQSRRRDERVGDGLPHRRPVARRRRTRSTSSSRPEPSARR